MSDQNFLGKTLLIAEDDDTLRETLVYELEYQGAKVLAASNGKEAFELIMNNTIDAVISDIKMPERNGIELLKHIKDINYSTPVLMFITGFTDLTISDAYQLGACSILSKPFDLDELLTQINNILRPKIIRWKSPFDCNSSKFKFEKEYESIESSQLSGELELGQGGAFVKTNGELPLENCLMEIDIKFTNGNLRQIEGCGIGRWTRKNDQGNLKRGFGVEFIHLNDEAIEKISEIIETKKIKSYIPNG